MLEKLSFGWTRLAQKDKQAIGILIVIVFLGTAVRLWGLSNRTITHIEMYVPGIELPAGLSDPDPRLSLQQTLVGMLGSEEPHPPAYYIIMQVWTRLFGSGILALRLPSVIFALATIPLLYLLGVREYSRKIGLGAAAMLALNGYHVFWSQLAKMYILACLLGVLSTLFLIQAVESNTKGKRLTLQLVYVGTTLLGLATSHYFWFLFIGHLIWVLLRSRNFSVVPHMLRVQLATIILGSPLLSLAIFQSRRPSYLSLDILKHLSQYLQFGILFEPDWNSPPPGLIHILGGIILTLCGLLLLSVGLRIAENRDQLQEEIVPSGPWSVIAMLATPIALLLILRLGRFTRGFDANYSMLVMVSSIIPPIILISYFIVIRKWRRVQKIIVYLDDKSQSRFQIELSSVLAVLPAVLLALISPAVNLLAARGLLLFVPFLLLVLTRGLVFLLQKNRYWAVLVAILIVVHLVSIQYYKGSYHEHPTDYKTLAEQWIPQIEESDLIFVQKHWVTTPIFYYLKANEYHFVGWDFQKALQESPSSRVWVLSFAGLPNPQEMEQALIDYIPSMNLEALGLNTSLYCPQE